MYCRAVQRGKSGEVSLRRDTRPKSRHFFGRTNGVMTGVGTADMKHHNRRRALLGAAIQDVGKGPTVGRAGAVSRATMCFRRWACG